MKKTPPLISDNLGASAVEFAILVPIWLLLFFGMLDYAWYLTNVMVAENAVASGARAGVKVKYWLEEGDDGYQNPAVIARNAVRHAFWLDGELSAASIVVDYKDAGNGTVEDDEASHYLEVKMVDYEYPLLTGYLPGTMVPRTISAVALMALP